MFSQASLTLVFVWKNDVSLSNNNIKWLSTSFHSDKVRYHFCWVQLRERKKECNYMCPSFHTAFCSFRQLISSSSFFHFLLHDIIFFSFSLPTLVNVQTSIISIFLLNYVMHCFINVTYCFNIFILFINYDLSSCKHFRM